jgi:hypothetical protein
MEDVVDAGVDRKLKTVGDSADALHNLEGSRVARPQLAARLRIEGLCRLVEEAQPDPSPTENSKSRWEAS